MAFFIWFLSAILQLLLALAASAFTTSRKTKLARTAATLLVLATTWIVAMWMVRSPYAFAIPSPYYAFAIPSPYYAFAIPSPYYPVVNDSSRRGS